MSKPTTKTLVPKLRFPEFLDAGEWEEKSLGELSQIVRGGSPRPIDEFITTETNGLNWLKIGDVSQEAKYVTHTQEKVSLSALKKTRVVNPGDLILSNSMSFGRPYILKIKTCIHDGWIAVTKIKGLINVDYLYYSISSPASQSYFSNNAAGSGVQNLNADIIKLLPSPLPKLAEQQKIADCLSSIDDLITAHTQKHDALKAHKKGLMQQLFPAEGETVPKLRFPEFRDAGEWEEKQLGEVATFAKGKGISKSDISLNGSQPCIRYGELYTHYKETINTVISYTDIPSNDLVLSQANDVIIPASGETQIDIATASCVLKSGIALGGDLNIVRTKMNGVFLSYYLNNAKKKAIAELAQGISVVHLYSSQLKTLNINTPKLSEQQRIAGFLSSIDELIAAQTQKIDALKAHKKGLMQQLFPASIAE
ncbi:MAG: restriction endonuclease subunit S [Methylotenera sp.]|uniref:restriction endonuclease subunit S n=1 Tax=Methylotenera sp. TaxID=2051956 RepID=UPI0024872B1E|nr:restriction endonuclease subunit S [Methylotenera sp.]MDI1308451.1 restriction endonuclease subunit S [Methylotenera sp.]